jgi:predicted SnoaL-like aldol condensation-catalyzing enzyme
MKDYKQAAVEFLKLVVARQADEAYEKYVDMHGKHHNPYFAAEFSALKQGMIEAHTKFPDTQIHIKNVLGDGDLVAVHSNVVMSPGEKGVAVVHLFRFRDSRIIEMWDVGQQVPADPRMVTECFK